MNKPRLKRDWIGRHVRLVADMNTKGGTLFKSGTIMEVVQNRGGLTLRTTIQCKECNVGRYHYISKVNEYDVELLPIGFVPSLPFVNGADLIMAERKRQIRQEGWTFNHDAQWTDEQLVWAALSYLLHKEGDKNSLPSTWPWGQEFWKPKDRLSNLIRAGALIAAEIDRIKKAEGK